MTKLNRPVRREINKYILMLVPPERDEPAIVKVKQKGKRLWYETTIDAIFWMAARKKAERDVAEKRAKRLARRGMRT